MGRFYFSRRGFLASGAALGAAPLAAQEVQPKLRPEGFRTPPPRPVREFRDILAEAGLSGERSIALWDLKTGRLIEGTGVDKPLPPASVMKVLTTLYALDRKGISHRFTTQIGVTGPIENGVVQGDILLIGGGDPHLDTDGLAELALQMAGRGIKGATGRFRVIEGALPSIYEIDTDQPDHVGYNPSISGMNLNFNRVFFEWARRGNGYRLSLTARAEANRPTVKSIQISDVGRALPVYAYAEAGRFERWTVARPAMGGSGSRWLPVRRPSVYAGEVFQGLARGQGITLPGAVVEKEASDYRVVAAVQSAQMRFMLRAMLRYSTNLTAEVTGLTASAAAAPVSSLAQSAARMQDWTTRKFAVKEKPRFVDHSGLGAASRLSAGDMVRILDGAGWHGALRPLLKDVRLKEDPKAALAPEGTAIVAKTGTLNFVSALAGYIEGANGRQMGFAIFTSDLKRRNAIPESQRERPPGGSAWGKRARGLQNDLLLRWAAEYGRSD